MLLIISELISIFIYYDDFFFRPGFLPAFFAALPGWAAGAAALEAFGGTATLPEEDGTAGAAITAAPDWTGGIVPLGGTFGTTELTEAEGAEAAEAADFFRAFFLAPSAEPVEPVELARGRFVLALPPAFLPLAPVFAVDSPALPSSPCLLSSAFLAPSFETAADSSAADAAC